MNIEEKEASLAMFRERLADKIKATDREVYTLWHDFHLQHNIGRYDVNKPYNVDEWTVSEDAEKMLS